MSPSTRVRLVVALVAVIAAALVVGVTVVQSGGDEEEGAPRAAPPPADAAPPVFYPDFPFPDDLAGRPPREQLEALERRGDEGDVEALLVLGAAYQRAGQRALAVRTYDRAVAAAPQDVRARVAAAVVRFDEDDPSAAFARLGPLTRSYPDEPVVRFHLGLLLVSLGQVAEAREQLVHAARGEGLYGREAKRLLERLEEIRT